MTKKISPYRCNIKNMQKTLLATSIAGFFWMPAGLVQAEVEAGDSSFLEEVLVTGIRQTLRTSTEIKRNSSTIVDALSSSELGSLPDLSVAETLERITGVAGDRFKGNASEISIRGLGPFLGSSTFNGRAISSGSGNRAVAFSQFPSELVNGLVVYKAQTADILEGGVSGVIDLHTIRPLDYGKQRIQADIKGNYNPYQAKFKDDSGWGDRESVSYTGVFETGIGGLGFAIGYAGSNTSSPEESYNTSSTINTCNSNSAQGGNCSYTAGATNDYYFSPNNYFVRQMESKETRDAVIMAMQWQPNDDWDVNLDGQWSNRNYYEDKNDLFFIDDGRRQINSYTTNGNGVLQTWSGNTRINNNGEYRVRDEDYKGGGINVQWQASPNLTITADAAVSDTYRDQARTFTRFRSPRINYTATNRGADTFPSVDLDLGTKTYDETIGDLSGFTGFYTDDSEARNARFDISDNIQSFTLKGDYGFDEGFLTSIKMGVAISTHEFLNYAEDQTTLTTAPVNKVTKLNEAVSLCGNDNFAQSNFGVDASSPFTSWATLDTRCAYGVLIDGSTANMTPDPKAPSSGDVNLTEDVASLFAMANFESSVGSLPLSGNLGVRYVTTDITSVGVRTAYTSTINSDGSVNFATAPKGVVEFNTFTNSYNNFLPSLNLNLSLSDETEVRFALYAAMSRPDMWYYGAARDINNLDTAGSITSVEQALVGNVVALGNPELEALKSNNVDLSYSWYPNDDTTLSAAIYYKTFNARIGSVTLEENVVVDGQSYTVDVGGQPDILNESSNIKGLELSAQHIFEYLPQPYNGLGVAANYNYADSSYETPDAAPNSEIPLAVKALLEPANLAGLSKNSFSGQVFWEGDRLTARVAYKFRSEYLKPFDGSLTQNNRIVDDTSSVDFDLSYNLTESLKAKFQAINITNESYSERRVVDGQYNRIEYSGVRYFVGLQFRM